MNLATSSAGAVRDGSVSPDGEIPSQSREANRAHRLLVGQVVKAGDNLVVERVYGLVPHRGSSLLSRRPFATGFYVVLSQRTDL